MLCPDCRSPVNYLLCDCVGIEPWTQHCVTSVWGTQQKRCAVTLSTSLYAPIAALFGKVKAEERRCNVHAAELTSRPCDGDHITDHSVWEEFFQWVCERGRVKFQTGIGLEDKLEQKPRWLWLSEGAQGFPFISSNGSGVATEMITALLHKQRPRAFLSRMSCKGSSVLHIKLFSF